MLTLQQGALQMGICLSLDQQAQCNAYLSLLSKWNKVHNLTAIRDTQQMLTKHLLDSFALYSKIISGTLIDVGTGAGLPGIPLAIARPEVECVLLDSQQKKINFLEHVIRSLKLPNVSVEKARVEAFKPASGFDWVVSRAFAELEGFVKLAGHLCLPSGTMVAMKGQVTELKIGEKVDKFEILAIEQVKIPDLDAARALVYLSPCAKKIPRGQGG